jgi:2-polyprenyl-3-methyl-5-hydroxy-6-metoxy-1,4-benzoquinol methylase
MQQTAMSNQQHANNDEVAKYYDNFKHHQKKLGINIRHRTIFSNLKKAGLRSDSRVLEIGCGIGTVSNLICGFITTGRFTGVDISKESIEHARHFNKQFANAEFVVSDMSDFKRADKYDYVVLPDVLEHIPVEHHQALFATIAAHSTENTIILINIPEPYTLDWVRRNKPEGLQIIDQSLSMQDLCNNVYPSGFYLYSVTPYALQYTPEDYLCIVLKRNRTRETVGNVSKNQIARRNLALRFGFE